MLQAGRENGSTESEAVPATGETCQWIDGAVSGDDACKCGRPVRARLPGGAPYCSEHAARVFESPAAWKARNAWIKELDGGFAQVTLRDWMGDEE